MMMNCAVLIPAYNASSSLDELLRRTRLIHSPEHTIVIDDGSRDGTGDRAHRAGVMVLTHGANRGKGAALQTGFDHALARGYDAVITMDADLQHKPEDIPRFLHAYETDRADVIIGSRLHALKGMPYHRRVSNLLTTFLVSARTAATIDDSQSGFRLIHARVLRAVRLLSPGFEAETEFIIKAAARQFTFRSVPIETIYADEKSSMTHWHTTKRFISVLMAD
jgi:glycosyltransferase involved in cell wall biosynthesis